jgi:hypothetical protein
VMLAQRLRQHPRRREVVPGDYRAYVHGRGWWQEATVRGPSAW